jgi:hypothetical protein
MKASAFIACCAVVAALVLLAACQPDNVAETDSCMECHSGDTTEGNAVLAAQDQYEASGHFLGPRTLVESTLDTGHMYVHHGSNSMYTNGSSCSKCHTHQGFVDFVAAGMPASWNQAYGAASAPGCFTCHKPHVSGDFSMRKETAETLVGGTSFNWGKGNLCVTCHKSLTDATTFLPDETEPTPSIYPKAWTTRDNMHHGPQADFMLGTNHRPFDLKTYAGASPHLDALSLPDSCVGCHLYQPSARLGGTLALGGHGMYLTGDVHGTNSNVIGPCRSCHNYPVSGTGAPILVSSAGSSMTGGFETALTPDTDVNTTLAAIRANRDLLIVYFGTDANFTSGGNLGGRRLTAVTGGDVTTAGEWEKDWVFTTSLPGAGGFTLTEEDSFAYWNFMYFIEDRSHGIHNPTFALQILWDSVEAVGLTPSGTRP